MSNPNPPLPAGGHISELSTQPRDALVLAAQRSGAIYYYTRFPVLRLP